MLVTAGLHVTAKKARVSTVSSIIKRLLKTGSLSPGHGRLWSDGTIGSTGSWLQKLLAKFLVLREGQRNLQTLEFQSVVPKL